MLTGGIPGADEQDGKAPKGADDCMGMDEDPISSDSEDAPCQKHASFEQVWEWDVGLGAGVEVWQ